MSKDNSKLVKEMDVLKEKLDKLEVQNAELKQQNIGLKEQNKEMKEQIVELANQNKKLVEEIGVMNAEKFEQDNPTQSSVSCPSSSQKIHGEKSTDLEENTEIYVRNWLTETLAWICRKQMANSALSTLCKTFKRLCWPKLHGNVKPHEVDSLHIRDEFDEESGNYQSKLLRTHRLLSGWDWDENEIPLASVQPPDYIIGFKGISIYFLNGQVMQFIECILPKINAFTLDFRPMIPIWHTADQITQIHGLYEMLAMKATSICDENFFDFLRIKPNAFGLIENPQTISAKLTIIEHINLLLQWLIRPLNDHKPKFFSIQIKEQLMAKFLDKIKEQFLGSTQSANFLISLEWWGTGYPNFTMENEQTGEVLALYSLAAFGGWNDDNYFLVRHQKGKEHLRADWEKQMEQLFRLPRVHVQITNTGEF